MKKLFGTNREHLEGVKVAVLMLIVTAVYALISSRYLAEYHFNLYEFLGTWTGLVCVWLSRTRNILCWPWGIVSSVLLGVFFMQIGLPGQQWLNWAYFVVIQFWAWPYWAFGGENKEELPVTYLTTKGRLAALISILAGTAVVYFLIDVFVPGSNYPVLDAIVVVSSIVAQFLLGKKKVESWVLWLGPVNLLSIVLFYLTGAYILTALYVAFFVHAVFALSTWAKANQKIYV